MKHWTRWLPQWVRDLFADPERLVLPGTRVVHIARPIGRCVHCGTPSEDWEVGPGYERCTLCGNDPFGPEGGAIEDELLSSESERNPDGTWLLPWEHEARGEGWYLEPDEERIEEEALFGCEEDDFDDPDPDDWDAEFPF